MINILKSSKTYQIYLLVYSWFGRKWGESFIISKFLSPNLTFEISQSSIFTRMWRRFHSFVCTGFEKLRLTKLLEGSIFKRAFIWSSLSVFLAPIIPTMALLALVLIAFASVFLAFGTDRRRSLSFSPVNMYIILYAFVYLAASFVSASPMDSVQTGLLIVCFTLFAIILQNSVNTRKKLDTLIIFIIISGVIVSLYGIYQYVFGITGDAAWVDADLFSDITNRVFSTLGNPNVLSEYLLLVIPFACAQFFASKKWYVKGLFFIFAGIMALCMVLTYSRGGWLALLIAAFIFLILLDRRFILLGILAVIALYFVLPDTVINRFTSIGNMSDTSTSYRVSIWLGTLAMLRDYWISGVGPGIGAFNKVYPAYSFNNILAPHSHNLFLQLVCETGVAGLILFIIIIYQFYKTAFRALSSEKLRESRYYLIGAVSSVSGFLVQGMTDYSFYNHRVMFMFWVVVAVGALLAKRTSMEEGENLWSES